ncbi:MAG TPA: T9SS type A sorting domain-containing protein, partial [Chitinophagaceae bacterium]
MKRFVLAFCALILSAAANTLSAQCAIKNVSFNIQNTVADGSGCKFFFDFSFEFNNNNGNKIVVIQAWKQADYPNYWKCTNGTSGINKAPVGADLKANGALPFLNIAFDMSTAPATVLSVYGPDNSVVLQGGYTVNANPEVTDADGFFQVDVSNMVITVPNQVCGGAITIMADVWSSQGNTTSQWSPHCVVCGNSFAFNYPLVAARIVSCDLPRTYEVSINNINTYQTITSTWKTYINNGPESLGEEDILVDQQLAGVTIDPGETFTSDPTTWTGSGLPPGSNADLIVEVTTIGLPNKQLADAPNPCAPLPVAMRSFVAARQKQAVVLQWETAAEMNNRGFQLQRNSRGNWETIIFVPSQAPDGNSTDLLVYRYQDQNEEKGVTQYRLRQVDIDGRATFSPIRSVRGLEQTARTIVYPNPGARGKVNVVFDDGGAKDVVVSDMNGRVVRRYGSAVNNLVVEGLQRGMYYFRISDLSSAASTVEKV